MILHLNPLVKSEKPATLLFDLDGTLYRGNQAIEGADHLIARCHQEHLTFMFVTNNSTRLPEEVSIELNKMGIQSSPDQVITSAMAAASYVRAHYPGELAYVIGEKGLHVALKKAGMRILQENKPNEEPVTVVVQGLDRTFTYEKAAQALFYLQKGAAFIMTNPDRLLPSNGRVLPGAGSVGAMLKTASGLDPFIVGKPARVLLDLALQKVGKTSEHAWMIGDNPFTDLVAAKQAGCKAVLLLTGLCSEENWKYYCNQVNVQPDIVCSELCDLSRILFNEPNLFY